ncbi:hypothetical protein KAT08_00240 [Candidatus Babeliales bacterium]|nr:hypothetical protein [Candidatus Babeliales bacterium]
MKILLSFWKKSLEIFYPTNLENFLLLFFKRIFSSTKIFLKYFGWLFLVDAFLFLWLGDIIIKSKHILLDPTKVVNRGVLLLHLMISVIWFILSVGYLLSIRKPYKHINWLYFRIGFFRYIQLAIIFSLIVLLIFNFLVSFGISIFPTLHWSLNVLIRLIELITIFYWLDSSYRFKEMFYSLEKALNFVLYNLPFFLILLFLWFGFRYLVGFIMYDLGFLFYLKSLLVEISFMKKLLIFLNSYNIFSIIKMLSLKYFLFFMDYFAIGFLFTFYSFKKKEKYFYSFFEKRN